MGVSFRELREVCQLPVRHGNDVAGLLFGDKASLPITKLFIDRGITPDVATVGMLVCGLAGAALQVVSPVWAVPGAALLLMYYIFDCVDGEVARFRRIENIRWGYNEYVFHMLVKPSAFVGVGIGLWLELGQQFAIWAAITAAVSVLWLKLLPEIPGIQFTHYVVGSSPERNRSFREFLPQADPPAPAGGAAGVFKLGFNPMTLRALGTNFDVGLALLLLATIADLYLPRFDLFGLAHGSCRLVWMLWYGVVVPLDFLDRLITDFRRDAFGNRLTGLMRQAHDFDVERQRANEDDDE